MSFVKGTSIKLGIPHARKKWKKNSYSNMFWIKEDIRAFMEWRIEIDKIPVIDWFYDLLEKYILSVLSGQYYKELNISRFNRLHQIEWIVAKNNISYSRKVSRDIDEVNKKIEKSLKMQEKVRQWHSTGSYIVYNKNW